MTRYISLSLAAIIAMILIVGSLSALPYPTTTPSGETASGKFNSYFTNTYRSAGIFDSSPSYTNGCAAGQVVRGFTTQGMLLCISPTSPQYWSSTDAGVNIYFTGSNVGIGTATPAAKLDVSGDVLINGVTVGRGGGNIANNTANGSSALFYNTTGNFNVANGYQSLVSNTTGAANSANGANTLRQNTVGSFNTANGSQALRQNTVGSFNTANGAESLTSNISGGNNTANGYSSLAYNTTGWYNTANGVNALQQNTTGNFNTANGYFSLQSNTIGSQNTANGMYALSANTIGDYNTANGGGALQSNTTGIQNTANGVNASLWNTTGIQNTANGVNALQLNTTGSQNTALGHTAGYNLTSGSNNIAIGYTTPFPSTTASNQLNIGNWIYGTSGNIGIGTTTPGAKLEIAGTIKITGGTPGVGKILTSDATGLASWENPSDMPIGAVVAFNTATCPTGWVAANGSGTIDLRGEFIRGLDSGRGVDIGRVLGSAQAGSESIYGVGTANGSFNISTYAGFRAQSDYSVGANNYENLTTVDSISTADYIGASASYATRNYIGRVRPRNVALLYCTKIASSTSTVSNNVTWSNVTGTSTGNVTLATTGNVGVGTTAPTAKLEINSGIAGSGGLRFTNLTSTSATGATNGKMLTVNGSGDVILVDSPTLVSSNLVKLYNEAWSNAAGKINNTSGYSFTVTASGKYLFDFVSTSYASSAMKTTTFAVRQGTTILASDSDTSFNNLVHVEYSGKMEVDLVAGTTYNVIITDSGVKNSGDWDRVYYKQVGGFSAGGGSSGIADLPVGSVMGFNLAACPIGWVLADGSGGTLDLRGEFIRGLDSGRGVDTGRVLGSSQSGTYTLQKIIEWTGNDTQSMAVTHGLGQAYASADSEMPSLYPTGFPNGAKTANGGTFLGVLADNTALGGQFNNNDTTGIGKWISSRPRNVALLYCMKLTSSASSPSSNLTWTNTNGSSTGNVILATTGNVGIGTIAPGTPLEINSTVDSILRLRQQGGGWNYMEFYNDTVRTAYLGMDTSNNLSMNGQLVVNTISGNVGIGTATPGAAVGMSGGLTINGTNATKITIEDNGVPAYALNTSSGGWTMFDRASGAWNASISSSGGNIGIGTVAPRNKLSIVGVSSTGDDTLPALGANGGKFAVLNGGGSGLYGLLQGVLGNGNVFLQAQRVDGTATAYNMLLNPNGGNVGIGTTTPGVTLDVVGQIRNGRDGVAGSYDTTSSTTTQSIWAISPTYDLNGAAATAFGNLYGMSYSYQGNGGLAGFGHQIGFHSNGTRNAAISLDNGNAFFNGNVGIGTTTPSAKLDVMGTYADPSLNVNSIATANFRTPGHVQLAINTSLTSPYTTSLQAKHSTLDGNAYPISLNPLGGNVGIGMTTPSAKLAVNGLGLIGGANQSAYDIGAGRIAAGGSIYSYGSMCVGNNFGDCSHATTGFVATTNTFRLGTKYFRDIGDGWIRMGNSTADYNGMGLAADNIFANTTSYAGAFIYNSDRRLKQNIVPLSDSLSKILSLNGYSFDWKKDGKHDIGVIAQEVEKVFPALVNINPITGMKGVEYGNLVAPIIEAIKELANNLKNNTTEIQSLKAENAVLKARLDAIEARLAK